MRICPKIQFADAKEMRRQGELAFTMIEIAIAIGVIGFALVAIIGILPAGMNVQKDNREDTLISQDAPYFLDAIRNGAVVSNGVLAAYYSAQGLDFLTNYVQSIKFNYVVNGTNDPAKTITSNSFGSGAVIIGLLSTPQNNYASPGFSSNYFDITATVRALSGPATEQQTGANTGISTSMAFTYQMEVMITPFNSFAPFTTNFTASYLDSNQVVINSNRWLAATPLFALPSGFILPPSQYLASGAGALQYNLFDVRLRFSWPVLQNGNVGPGRQTYRTLIAEPLAFTTIGPTNCWFFQPQTYTNVYPNGL
jgi:type II secretory pathway pseudopilin PulG